MNSILSSDKKKSILLSLLLYGTMLLILFFIRFWPPANLAEITGGGGGGVTINFGDSDLGSGENYKSEVLEVKNQSKLVLTKATPDEPILTQENATEETAVLPKKEKPLKPSPILKESVNLVMAKPKVSNTTNEALSSILKGSNKGGDGDDKTAGNKGKSNGSLSSNGYYGTGGSGGGTGGGNGNGNGNGIGNGSGYGSGSGGGSGYSLGNRKATSKPAPKYTCNETGKVVVEVSVDRNGRTTNVIAGIKGTTNTAKCLLDQATIAAMNTRWDASSDAPEKQVGKIVYNFNFELKNGRR
jgi:outer membrane biosynthesis protein TonB